MPVAQKCERCGAMLPRMAHGGLCPLCLLGQELDVQEPVKVASNLPPQILGDYILLGPIGQGGMGVVYKARQRSLDRIVALKLLPFGPFTREAVVTRFHAEARAVACLRHPNIVAIHEVSQQDGHHFFSMDFIDGPNLAEVAHGEPMPIARAVRLVRTVAEAVQHAHAQGILHRDLKPSNILLDPLDQPHVTDFGLAKNLGSDSPTLTREALGSPNYLPPEQAEARQDIGPATDVYALGAVLYHLLTGRPPFVGDSVTAVLRQVTDHDAVAPHLLNPDVPRDVETICLKCLQKDPARRYATAQELADELARFQQDEPIRARPAGPAEKLWRWARRRPALALALAACLLMLSLGLIATSWQWRRAEQHGADLAATVTRLKLDQAEDRLASGATSEGLALLASMLRADPQNQVAAQRIVSTLTQRNFIHPLLDAAYDHHFTRASAFAQHGDLLISATNRGHRLQVWNTAAGFRLMREIDVGEQVRLSTFSPDGRWLLTATQQRTLRLFDLNDGSLREGPHRTANFAEQLILSPDNTLAVVVMVPDFASSNYRRMTGAVIRLRDGERMHKSIRFHWAEFSPDAKYVVTVDRSTATIRDAFTWERAAADLKDESRINMAAFSPNSRYVVTAGAASEAIVWETATGKRLHTLKQPVHVQAALFSPDGNRILTLDLSLQGRLWDTASGQQCGESFPLSKGLAPTSFSPDGKLLATFYAGKQFVLRSGVDGATIAEPLALDEALSRARFLPDGRRVITTAFDGHVRLWGTELRAATPKVFPEKVELGDASLGPDGRFVGVGARSSWARIWNTESGQPVGPALMHWFSVNSFKWSPNGRLALTAGGHHARLWDAATCKQLAAFVHGAPIASMEFSPDGRWIATASEDRTARIWNTNGQPASAPLPHSGIVTRVCFSPEANLLVTAARDGNIRFWTVPDGRPVSPSLTNRGYYADAAFSPEGKRLLTWGAGEPDGALIWDVATRRALTPPMAHGRIATSGAFSPDGARVVTASLDGTIRIWEAASGRPIGRQMRHRGGVNWAGFSPDSRFILATSGNAARIWDAATGHAVSDLFQHHERIVNAEWARDGRRFLTASFDRTAKLWPVFLMPQGPAPSWLAELAETAGGLRLEGEEVYRMIPLTEMAAIHNHLRSIKAGDPWSEWLNWHFTDREPLQTDPQPPDEP